MFSFLASVKRIGFFAFTICTCTSIAAAQTASDYFRTDGIDIVNPAGEPIVMRGVGLGGWLMPEGYMLHVPGVGSPTAIREMIEDVIGPTDADTFYEVFEANYVAEKDIEAIADWGFDHIRLPFHYKVLYNPDLGTFKEEGFELFDRFIEWCRSNDLYVILDMHAAPGAQSEHNIADSDGEARLWTEPVPYQDQTVDIWAEIARRYAGETQIIGYDLINEPVTPDGIANPGQKLRDLYVRITDAIRTVDPYHIVFIEGNYFATTFDNLFPPFDENMVYAFHKYWNPTDQGTIQYLVNIRTDHQTPLWLGESGENSNPWFYDTIQLMERNNIGWNWWTHKKINTLTSPLSAPFSEGYQDIIDYWNGDAAKPSASDARETLFALAANLAIDSTEVREGVLRALFDPNFGTEREPFKKLTIPGEINAVDYDFGNNQIAYFDQTPKAVDGFPAGGNSGNRYRNDGVDIEESTDPLGFGYNVGWIDQNEWIKYTVNIERDGIYDVDFRVASANSNGGGNISISLEGGASLGSTTNVPNTGGWQSWVTRSINGVALPAGQQTLKVSFGAGGYNLNRMTFKLVQATDTEKNYLVKATRLLPHYPNPFSREVNLRFETEAPGEARFQIYDLLGRKVDALPSFHYGPGEYTVPYAPDGLAAGTYVYRIELINGSKVSFLSDQFIYSP